MLLVLAQWEEQGGPTAECQAEKGKRKVLVLDSNFILGGDGHEIIGTHIMELTDLINAGYRDVDCVYEGGC